MRVVSLVPSWTEFLHDLSVDVVGQTKFCVRPPEAFRRVPRVGGTKTADVEVILALKPDLVVANLEENDREQVEALQEACPRPPRCGCRMCEPFVKPGNRWRNWGNGLNGATRPNA